MMTSLAEELAKSVIFHLNRLFPRYLSEYCLEIIERVE